MSNLACLVAGAPADWAERPALRLDEHALTYRALDEASARVAAMLSGLGLVAGDRVGVMLPNVLQFPVVYYGILRAGCVVVPMNPLLKSREVAYYLSDAQAKVAFVWHGFAEEGGRGAEDAGAQAVVVAPTEFEAHLGRHEPTAGVADRDAEDTAVLLYTSGTTGQPKGAQLTHANLLRNAQESARLFTLGPGDVVFGGLPLFHSFGQTCGMNAVLSAGSTLTLLPRFDPTEALRVLERDRVTVMQGVPTMYGALLQHPRRGEYDLSALSMGASGGASLPVEVLRGFEAAFGCPILEGYGLSETSPVASFNHSDGARKPGSIGTPINGVAMRLVDDEFGDVAEGEVGEIAISGHNVMKGYWNRPEATADAIRDGWFRTGDIARRDEDGYYFIVDRKKDLIIRGGYNVYPREIEEVLYTHPAVGEAAVIGTPHPTHGEEVAAVVALKPGATATSEELRDFTKDRVAAYKYPRHVWLVDSLPKGPTGKILKREIVPPAPATLANPTEEGDER
ncbi:long-chain fatty acid--CoA ligase [Streptomyces sp. NPDC001978]|uniref:long-chain-fatty-acid--CoA ligase n=1 Tax=Streptomyces sp. NPDC001978 TaxID=3364627 RepID=UPI00367717EA